MTERRLPGGWLGGLRPPRWRQDAARPAGRMPALLFLLLTSCASTLLPIPSTWSIPPTKTIDAPSKANHADVRIAGGKLVRGEKELTPELGSIEWYDVSAERKEVIFAAKKKGRSDADIGLVSIDGSEIHWIFEEPADERMPQWASRGNKIAFIIDTPSGDLVRTVHIPTAATINLPFRGSRIRSLAWTPEGDRLSLVLAGVKESEHVESMKYDGQERRVDVAPAERLDVDEEPFAGGVLLRPSVMRYGDRYPLVVWLGDPAGWNDARGALLREGGIACAIVRTPPDAAFWEAVAELKNIDPSRVWVVGAAGDRAGVTYITPSPDLPAGRYRTAGHVLYAPPAVVQSVAVGFIADQLKRTGARNGSHR